MRNATGSVKVAGYLILARTVPLSVAEVPNSPEFSPDRRITTTFGIGSFGPDDRTPMSYRYKRLEGKSPVQLSLNAEPIDGERTLGQELDIIFGMAIGSHLNLKFAAGIFMPGHAFADQDDLLYSEAEIEFSF